jgi:endonuclease/exonuclease/phosphatase family metal-dependent hydrolase
MPTPTFRAFTLALIAAAAILTTACAAHQPTTTDHPFADSDTIAKYEDTRVKMRRFGIESAPDKPEGTLRLTTYNIENLFDAHDDPTLSGRNEDIDDTKPEHQLIATAMAIRAVNPDILCIQEVESESALIEYRDTYLADMGYDHLVSIDAGNERGIENAVLSRYPITSFKNWPLLPLGGTHPEMYGTQKNWYAGEPIVFRRSPLMVDVQIPTSDAPDADTWTLTLFVMHHKSGRYNAYWRESEAKGTLKLLQEVSQAHPDRPIVVLGDFNATPKDDSVRLYLDAGYTDLFGSRKESPEIITHESERRIDLILANDHALQRMRTDDAFVYGLTSRPEGSDWRDLPTFEGYASDHYPVSVDLNRDLPAD